MKTYLVGLSFVVGLLTSNISLAVTVNSSLLNDFEDGLPHGWKKGSNASPRQFPKVVEEANGNHYLEVTSVGGGPDGRGPSSRMTVINETEWRGNYNSAGVGSIKARMKNMGDDTLYMRVGFTTRAIEEWHFAASKDPLELPADGKWYDLSFAISEEYITPFLGNEGECCFPEWDFKEVVGGVNQLKFHNGKDAHFWGGERLESTLGIDDIHVSSDVMQAISLSELDTTPVPLPASFWLFMTGLISTVGLKKAEVWHDYFDQIKLRNTQLP